MTAIYRWDWVNTGDQEHLAGEGRVVTLQESYVVRAPDGTLFCVTNKYESGYKRARDIAYAMNRVRVS